ncbi:unnamed protein product [Prunus brigantina]
MDAISQLQEKVNTIATIAFTTIGTLQRDAPPVRISPNYPESGSGPAPAPNPNPTPTATADSDADFAKQPKLMSAELVKAAKQFDALVAALPLSEGGEEAQLKRIAQLEAENDAVGQQLEKQLEAAVVKGGIFFHLPSLLPFKSSHQIREGAYANDHHGR